MTGKHDSRSVANQILEIAEKRNIKLTMMQLLKLVYVAHGWRLTLSDGQGLTSDNPQAWQYGPVFPAVYHAVRKYGRNPIPFGERIADMETGLKYLESFSPEESAVIELVVTKYGNLSAFRLSAMTHRPGTPWTITSRDHGHYAPIPDFLIKDHFDDLRKVPA